VRELHGLAPQIALFLAEVAVLDVRRQRREVLKAALKRFDVLLPAVRLFQVPETPLVAKFRLHTIQQGVEIARLPVQPVGRKHLLERERAQ